MTNKGNGKPPPIGKGPNAQKKKESKNFGARWRQVGNCAARGGATPCYGAQKDTKMSTKELPVGTYPQKYLRKVANPNNLNHILIKTCPNPIIMQHILIILIILIFLKKKKGAGG